MNSILFSFLCTIFIFSITYNASAEKQFNEAILMPFNDTNIVVIGKIVNSTGITSENKTQYDISIEKYLQNPQSYESMSVIGDGIAKKITNFDEVKYYNDPVFGNGDTVFLYLNNGNGQYTISPYSFSITKSLPQGGPPNYVDFTNHQTAYYGSDAITVSGMIEKGYLYKSSTELGANSTVSILINNPHNEKYLLDQVSVQPDGSFDYEFKIKGKSGISGNYQYSILVGTSLVGGSFEYFAHPLQQFESGISIADIKCENGFQVITKLSDGSPACVKPNTSKILIERGWAKMLS